MFIKINKKLMPLIVAFARGRLDVFIRSDRCAGIKVSSGPVAPSRREEPRSARHATFMKRAQRDNGPCSSPVGAPVRSELTAFRPLPGVWDTRARQCALSNLAEPPAFLNALLELTTKKQQINFVGSA